MELKRYCYYYYTRTYVHLHHCVCIIWFIYFRVCIYMCQGFVEKKLTPWLSDFIQDKISNSDRNRNSATKKLISYSFFFLKFSFYTRTDHPLTQINKWPARKQDMNEKFWPRPWHWPFRYESLYWPVHINTSTVCLPEHVLKLLDF
jgi:hypothetical protein